jgi:hypothetical protein
MRLAPRYGTASSKPSCGPNGFQIVAMSRSGMVHRYCKRTKFTWSGSDLPRDNRFESFSPRLDSKVVEYVPESRFSWVCYGANTVWGPVCDAYHTWLLTPTSAKKCHVIFEEVATGLAAQHARGVYPEILHLGHQRWLEQLKKISESRTSKGLALASPF